MIKKYAVKLIALSAFVLALACGDDAASFKVVAPSNSGASAVDNGTTGAAVSALPAFTQTRDPEVVQSFTQQFLLGDWYDNFQWQASKTTMSYSNLAKLDNLSFSTTCVGDTGNGFMHMTVTGTTDPTQLWGAELIHKDATFHFGYYEVRMKASSVPGLCMGFFFKDKVGPEEIDIEFLHHFTAGAGKVHFTLHPHEGVSSENYYRIHDLTFNPSDAFHTYGFNWTSTSMEFYVDGVKVYTFTDAAGAPIQQSPGSLWLNCWTGNYNWGGGPPSQDAVTIIDWVKYWPRTPTSGISEEYLRK